MVEIKFNLIYWFFRTPVGKFHTYVTNNQLEEEPTKGEKM